MHAPSCSHQAQIMPGTLHFRERAPAAVDVPADAQALVAYVFENAAACLAINGLAGGIAHLLPGEWLRAPVVAGSRLTLTASSELAQHGLLHFVRNPVEQRQHLCKCEIPVNIGPGWRLRRMGSPAGQTMLDVFMETGSVLALADANLPAATTCPSVIYVLSGEVMCGGQLLRAGEHAVLPLESTQMLATSRTQYLLLQNMQPIT